VTAEIIRKLILGNNPPKSAYLIIQKEAAWRYCSEKDSTLFSAMSYPWFYFHLIQNLNRNDFDPVPAVEPVFMAIHKRETPFISDHDKIIYKKFISFGFCVTKKNLKLTFKNIFSYNQWKRLSKDLGFSLHASARELNNQQWLGLFRYFKTGVAKDRTALIEGYHAIK
jgi:23S rRNA (adenine-N6)-dimethyltransferase